MLSYEEQKELRGSCRLFTCGSNNCETSEKHCCTTCGRVICGTTVYAYSVKNILHGTPLQSPEVLTAVLSPAQFHSFSHRFFFSGDIRGVSSTKRNGSTSQFSAIFDNSAGSTPRRYQARLEFSKNEKGVVKSLLFSMCRSKFIRTDWEDLKHRVL